MPSPSKILDHNGEPVSTDNKSEMTQQAAQFAKSFSNYQRQLGLQALGVDPNIVAQQPHEAHSWVYAAVMVQSLGIGGVPFGVFRETEDAVDERKRMAKRAGRTFKLKRGKNRHSWIKYIKASYRRRGFFSKKLEPDFDNDVQFLLDNPNPYMSGSQLWQASTMFMALLGECFWIKTGPEGTPWIPGTVPDQLWIIAPTQVDPLFVNNQLAGWEITVPKGLPVGPQGTRFRFRLDEIIHFKYIDPLKPYRGLAPLSAAARGIALDLATSQTNYGTVMNGSAPNGMITTDQWLDEAQRTEVKTWYEENHSGPRNAGTIPVSFGGLKFQATGLSPRDMEYLDSRRWNRDEILSVFGVTKASVGVTDDLNYATQLSQDRNLWTKRLLPMMMLFEAEVNKQLLGGETDDVVGMFQVQGVDALRLGMAEEVEIAAKLADSKLHMPPNLALELSGLEVPDYEASDVAFVPAGLLTAETVASLDIDTLLGTESATPAPAPAAENNLASDSGTGVVSIHKRSRKATGRKIWKQLMIVVEIPTEVKFSRDWKKWVRVDKTLALEKFDSAVGLASKDAGKNIHDYSIVLNEKEFTDWLIKADPIVETPDDLPDDDDNEDVDINDVPDGDEFNFSQVLLDLLGSQNRLRVATRRTLIDGGELTFNFTVSELGGPQIVTYGYDDPRIQRVLELSEKRLVGNSPVTLQKNLRKSLSVGLQNGETLGQLRNRVAEQYDKFGTPSKTLQVARTETATMMNSVRQSMFLASGITQTEWITAGDEEVRPDHQHFGVIGPQNEGFNYLTTVNRQGKKDSPTAVLEYPSDLRGPADEVINCRCVHVPA